MGQGDMKKPGINTSQSQTAEEAKRNLSEVFNKPLSASHTRALAELLGIEFAPPTPLSLEDGDAHQDLHLVVASA
uniref:Uncharacterized protein n=1 Tax=Oryza brachyantha TaxID=4533 RepID=J3L8M7_ORYBR